MTADISDDVLWMFQTCLCCSYFTIMLVTTDQHSAVYCAQHLTDSDSSKLGYFIYWVEQWKQNTNWIFIVS